MTRRMTHSIVRAYPKKEVAFLAGEPAGDFRPAGYWLPATVHFDDDQPTETDSQNDLQHNPHDYLPPIDEAEPYAAQATDSDIPGLARSDSLERLGSAPHTIGEVLDQYHKEQTSAPSPSDLPFEPDPQHSCSYGSDRHPSPPRRATMDDEHRLITAFFSKHADAVSVELKHFRRAVRDPTRPGRTHWSTRYEVWISLANRHVITERGLSLEELFLTAGEPAA